MFWYHAVATGLSAAVVTVTGVLYLRWRSSAIQAEDALSRLRASEALREDLTNMLIHDLKNPLAASLGGAQLLLLSGRSLSDTDRELLTMSIESQHRLVGMIGDLLDIARAEAGGMPLNLIDNDPGSVVWEAVDEARNAAGQANVELTVVAEACAAVRCDRDKLHRVVANLLANAIKYTPARGRVTVVVRASETEAVVTVKDTGPGIPQDQHDRIFGKFGQAEAFAGGHHMSVGLGLTFCKLAVEAHGGRIWVSSSPGEGSAFSFALPLLPRQVPPACPSGPPVGGPTP